MTNYALIIAINDYPASSEQDDLKGAVADGADFAEWVLDPNGGGVADENLLYWIYGDPHNPGPMLSNALTAAPPWPIYPPPDFSKPPDDKSIIDAAEALANRARSDGEASRIFLFFAGHGVQWVPKTYDRDAQTCFIAGNFQPGRSRGQVPLGDLLRLMERIGPAETIIFQDCCRSDLPLNADRPTLDFNPIMDQKINEQWVLGNAVRDGRVALEVPFDAPDRGAYSKVLVQALRQFRPGGILRASELRNFVDMGVQKAVDPKKQPTDLKMRYEGDDCVISSGPAIGSLPEIAIELLDTSVSGSLQLLSDEEGVVAEFTDLGAEMRTSAPVGIYILVNPESGRSVPIFHIGPEETYVQFS